MPVIRSRFQERDLRSFSSTDEREARFFRALSKRTALASGAGALLIGLLTAFSPHVWARGWPRLDAVVAAFALWTVVPFALLAGSSADALSAARVLCSESPWR